jgi:integrase
MTRDDVRRALTAARDRILLGMYDMVDPTLARFSRFIPERLYQRLERAISRRQMELLQLPRHLVAEPLRPAATFAYITGWRIDSEVLPLEWRQVDFGAGEVRLDPGKTKNGEGRTFPMTRDLREMLEQQRAITENLQRQLKIVCPRVFHRSGRPIKSFRVAFRSACAEAGCPGRVLHDFRRTAVRNLVRAGIPERVAMQMTGHKTRSVFERYNIVSAGDLREAARRLDIATGTISGTIEQNQRSVSKA